MSAEINDGGPTLPIYEQGGQGVELTCFGISVRDYFAAKAMQSVLDGSWPDLQLRPQSGLSPIENSAVFSFQIADAMLKAREQS